VGAACSRTLGSNDVNAEAPYALFVCPAGCADESYSLWGTDVYTLDSSVCAAGLHSGALSSAGGVILVTWLPGQESCAASDRNGGYPPDKAEHYNGCPVWDRQPGDGSCRPPERIAPLPALPGLDATYRPEFTAYNPASGRLAASLSQPRGLRTETLFFGVYDPSADVWQSAQGMVANLSLLTFSPEGALVVAQGPGGNSLWEAATMTRLRSLAGDPLVFSSDSRLLYEGGRIVEPRTGAAISMLRPNRFASAVAFHTDGSRVAVAYAFSGRAEVDVYSTGDWSLLYTLVLTGLTFQPQP